MSKNKKEATIIWKDAVGYYNFEEIPNGLSEYKTTGEIVRDKKDFIILKNPKTKDYNPHNHHGIREKKKDPTFLFIPRGMVQEIKEE